MFLPSSVKVGPYDYRIVVDEPGEHEGEFRSRKMEIGIVVKDRHPRHIAETLLHEILHAVNHVADVGDTTDEEASVTRSSPILFAVMRDNPDLMDYLLDERT